MAWDFYLAAECGAQKSTAEIFAKHFAGLKLMSLDGRLLDCLTDVREDEGAWWAIACPQGIPRDSVNEKTQVEFTQLGHQLYGRLRSAPAYRFALVGVEVLGFRTIDELEEAVTEFDFQGLVVAERLWQAFANPGSFAEFAPGYRWLPFVRAR